MYKENNIKIINIEQSKIFTKFQLVHLILFEKYKYM
jgi:hypothetical protein